MPRKENVIKDEWETVNKAVRCGHARRRTSLPSSTPISTNRSADSEALLAWSHNKVEGLHRVHATALRPGQGAAGPWNRDKKVGLKLMSSKRVVHHGRRRSADAGVPALCEGRGRLGRSAAQRLARVVAGEPRGCESHPRRQHPPRVLTMLDDLPPAAMTLKGQVRRLYKEFGAVLEGRVGRRLRQPRASVETAALRVVRRITGRQGGRRPDHHPPR